MVALAIIGLPQALSPVKPAKLCICPQLAGALKRRAPTGAAFAVADVAIMMEQKLTNETWM